MTTHQPILDLVDKYYTQRVREFGATCRGVDWNSEESQKERFRQLLKLIPDDSESRTVPFGLLDYGCGYGALLDYILQEHPEKRSAINYSGFDVSQEMIELAEKRHPERADQFATSTGLLTSTDFVVASGLFNVRQTTPLAVWEQYVFDTIAELHEYGRGGFAFNVLTSYSDPEYMRDDLYYANPCVMFDYCKRLFSRNVALLHDYGLYEFTIIVRSE